jgi:predicted ATPase with chaperone activity
LPRALTVDGQIIILVDPVFHIPVDEPIRDGQVELVRDQTKLDERFAHVQRPTVFVGGELTMDQLDLRYDPHSKIYQAPFQLKATGGVLIVDDFGRQRMRPSELLNRWIVPLEKEEDNLSLYNGLKFPVPFDCHLVFATNLNPRDLVDESFLRRIQYKVEIKSPTRDAYSEIMRLNCEEFGMTFEPEAVDLLFSEYYDAMGFPPRGCHPRDLIKQITSVATFAGIQPTLEPELLHRAARSYFLVMEEEYVAGIPSLSRRSEQ